MMMMMMMMAAVTNERRPRLRTHYKNNQQSAGERARGGPRRQLTKQSTAAINHLCSQRRGKRAPGRRARCRAPLSSFHSMYISVRLSLPPSSIHPSTRPLGEALFFESAKSTTSPHPPRRRRRRVGGGMNEKRGGDCGNGCVKLFARHSSAHSRSGREKLPPNAERQDGCN